MIIGFFYAVIDMSIWWFKTLIFQHLAILFSNKTNRFPSHLLLIFLCACCWIVYFTFRLVGKEGKKQTVNELTNFWSIVKEQFSISGISKQQNNNLGTQIIHY